MTQDAADCMDFESATVMSTLNVADVAASLEQAATKVKELTRVTGALDVKASVEELTAQVKIMHGVAVKQHTETLAAFRKLAEVTSQRSAAEAQQNKLLLAAIQAQTHHQLTVRVREKLKSGEHNLPPLDKKVVVLAANKYGWKIGEKNKKRQYDAQLETDEEQIARRWLDALTTLETVTIPELTKGEAGYGNFVK